LRVKEHANGGHSGGTCGEAVGSVGGGDAAEGEDGDGRGGGYAEGFETDGGSDSRTMDGFAEDGAEEDGVGLVGESAGDLVERVAGDGDEGSGEIGATEERADLWRGEFVGGGGEVEAGGAGGEGDVGAGVDEQAGAGAGGGDDFDKSAGERSEFGCGEVFFAELDELDSLLCPTADEADEREAAGGLVAGKLGTVRNRAAKHGMSVAGEGRG